MMALFNKDNFMLGTFADFKKCKRPKTDPDFVSDSGSKYWYVDDGVIRASSHWGPGIRTCDWYFEGKKRNAIAILYKDDFVFRLKKYGKGEWNKHRVMAEKNVSAKDIEEAFSVMDSNIVAPQPKIHVPEKIPTREEMFPHPELTDDD